MAGPNVVEVNEGDFEEAVLEASRKRPVVVDFWAGWCRPCLVLGPILERLADEYGGKFTLAKLDVDANQSLSAQYGIQGIPAVKAFVDGAVASEFVGAQPEQIVRRFLDELVPGEADDLVAEARAARSPAEAEDAYRRALVADRSNPEAAVGLAEMLLDWGQVGEAKELLAGATPTPEVARLQADIELREVADAPGDLADVARAAIEGDDRRALERALEALTNDGDRDEAHALILRLFDRLGADHPLTREFRPRLASALF